MFVIYTEFAGKDEVVQHVQEFLGFAETEEEFYDYLHQYKMPDYMVFEEPSKHLPPGSLSFRITNNLSSVYLIAHLVEPLSKAKQVSFPPPPAA